MNDVNVSEFLQVQQVDANKDISIGWNRFFPTIFILNRFALELLDAIRDKKSLPQDEETGWFLKELFKYKFIYPGEKDPAKDDFIKMMEESLAAVKREGDDFFRLKKAYEGITVFTDECNLSCPYCVNQYKRKHLPIKRNSVDNREIACRVIDQYVLRKLEWEQENLSQPRSVNIFFNGGEILLEWGLIKEIVLWLREKYKGVTFEYHMNTNLTLMTEEIAQFLAQHNFKIDISIDGYEYAHNRTRKYHHGNGSFADILRGLSIYRKLNKKNPLTGFQGTINFVDDFDPVQVYAMEKHGFLYARLAPNLLNVTEEDALNKARVMGKFLELNEKNQFQVSELFFLKAKDRINLEDYRFSFNCQGLGCFPRMSVSLNLSTLRVSLICSYVHDAWLSLEDLEYDIYNPKLWHRAYRFIQERAEAIKKYCFDCHLVGLCNGGCIYTGLDNENRLNKAACVYQEELWRIYINKVYKERKTS